MKINECNKETLKARRMRCKKLSLAFIKNEWLEKISNSKFQDKYLLINIWLSIFAVNARSLINPNWILDQIKSIEEFQLSSYENLLYSQITNPALLFYFNAFKNKKNNPNENLGRELLELYTVGEGNFTEEDVKNISLALTGIILDKKNNIKISKKFHYQGETIILGKKKKFDLKSLIGWLVKQPSTAENVSRRFSNYLLGDEIDKSEIDKVIKDFKESNLDLKTLYRSLLKNERYIKTKKFGNRLIDPITLVSKSIALIGSKHPNNYEIGTKILKLMGQPLFEPPSPEGWPFGKEWITASRILNRKKGLKRLIADEEIWETRNTPNILSRDLVPFDSFNLSLPAKPTRENIAKLITDPSWNFSGPINLNF